MDKVDILLDYHLITKKDGSFVFFKDYETFREHLKKIVNGDDADLFYTIDGGDDESKTQRIIYR